MTEPSAVAGTGDLPTAERARGLGRDAWRELRRKPAFLVSAAIILVVLAMAIAPGLFTSADPNHAELAHVRQGPSAQAWFGYDLQGRDVYSRVVHGTRASVLVGLFSTLLTLLVGGTLGVLAGYHGRIVDSLISRFGDIFAGLPFVLGAIVILTTFNSPTSQPGEARIVVQVVLSIAVLSWPVCMRIMRSATLVARQLDYVRAARALGASSRRVMVRHLLPNTAAPVLVYATIALGAFIGAEATLAYLGIGLRPPVVSWGVMINDASNYVRAAPHMLLFPAGFVTATVLAFVLLGDAVRDALDPTSR